jgi:hypothetical protein
MGTRRIISNWWIVPAVIAMAVVSLYVLSLVFPGDNNAKWVQRGADVAKDLRPLAGFLKRRAFAGAAPPGTWDELAAIAANGADGISVNALRQQYPELEYFGSDGMVDKLGDRWILLVPTGVPGNEWAGITTAYEVRFLRKQDR